MKIILMALDTLRYDHLGCYGHPMQTTPCLDRLAEEGVVFQRHYSTDVPTPPAYTAMMTGRRGMRTGIFGFGHTNEPFDRSTPMLAQLLVENGHRTGMISNLLYVFPWLVKGFHQISPPGLRFQGGTAEEVTAEACVWLDRHHAEDFFLFVHYWDPHQNYFNRAPEEYQKRFRKKDYTAIAPSGEYFKRNPMVYDQFRRYAKHNYHAKEDPAEVMPIYDAAIRYMDDSIADLVAHMGKLGIDEDTLLMITSDHGEAFGERGFYDHLSCYENISHVPFIVRWPGGIRGGRKVEGYSMVTDIMPTLLDMSGASLPEGMSGASLKQTLLEDVPTPHEEVVTDGASMPIQRMYIRDDWALVHTLHRSIYEYLDTYELFDIAADKAQEKNLAPQETGRFHEMRSAYDAWLDRELAGKPDRLQAVVHRGGGWCAGSVIRGFYENPALYYENPAIRELLLHHLGQAATEYYRKATASSAG